MKRELSLENDLYLDAHRFKGTPYLPFVMGLDIVYESMFKEPQKYWALSDYEVHHPIFLRKDKPKNIEIVVSDGDEWPREVRIEDGDIQCVKGTMLDPKSIDLSDYHWSHKRLVQRTYPASEIYPRVIPHGDYFHCNFYEYDRKDSMIVGRIQAKNKSMFCKNKSWHSHAIHPTLMDGLLQVCGLHLIDQENKLIIPVRAEGIYVARESFVHCLDVEFEIHRLDNAIFSIEGYGPDGELVALIKKMEFTELQQRWSPNVFE